MKRWGGGWLAGAQGGGGGCRAWGNYFVESAFGLEVLGDGVVAAEDVGAVGVGGAVALDGIAVGGEAGGDEEGGHQVGFRVGGGGLGVGEEGLRLADQGLPVPVPLAQGGVDEAEGEEAGLLGLVVHVDVVVGGELLQPDGVAQALVVGDAPGVQVAELLHQLLLEVAEEVALHEGRLRGIDEGDVAGLQVHEVDAPGAVEDVHADVHAQLLLPAGDFLDDSAVPFPRLDVEDDLALHLEVGDGLVEVEEEVLVADGGHEPAHVAVPDGDLLPLVVAVVVEAEAGAGVPGGGDDAPDALFGGLDEDEAEEVAPQFLVAADAVVGLAALVRLLLRLERLGRGHVEVGDVEAVGGVRRAVLAELALAVFLQQGLYLHGVQVAHDVPVLCVVVCRCVHLLLMFECVHYFSLSLQFGLRDESRQPALSCLTRWLPRFRSPGQSPGGFPSVAWSPV